MSGTLSSAWTERARLALGFVYKRGAGSHKTFVAPNGAVVTLPLGHAQVAERWVRKACAQAGVDWAAFQQRY